MAKGLAGDADKKPPGTGGPSGTTTDATTQQPQQKCSPKELINGLLPEINKRAGTSLTPQSVSSANAAHTHLGSASDHAGNGNDKWAVDIPISCSAKSKEVASWLSTKFGTGWAPGEGSGFSTKQGGAGHIQVIHCCSTCCGNCGEHQSHIHFGARGDWPCDGGGASDGAGNAAMAGGGLASAKAAIFATRFNFASEEDVMEAQLLQGVRSLMNDKPLFPFIQQLTEGSMRKFQSLPDGSFFAFFADYFGAWQKRDPYWEIYNIEILDGKIDLNDEALVTHQFVVGDTAYYGMDDPTGLVNILSSAGIVNLFNVGVSDFINIQKTKDVTKQLEEQGKKPDKGATTSTDKATDSKDGKSKDKTADGVSADLDAPLFDNKDEVIAFLQRYGARPQVEDAPFITSQWFEVFYAFQLFMLAWSRQFTTQFTFTFMPELFPGGIVAFPEHHLQCYIEEVSHVFDYEQGFTTVANLSAPASIGADAPSDGLSGGMVRSLVGREPGTPTAPEPHGQGVASQPPARRPVSGGRRA